ncbi:zinc finger protein 592 [Eucyclogobius newberryi]|uniref:zinc finger protein 592 n=1 Tax=Eucyclogobius newberryi TaxID=166745 RepID=UPI003B5B9F62
MGDVKTPDFDDLLAAFDIPDATGLGAKEAVEESKGELDRAQNPIGVCLEEDLPPTISTDVPAVNVKKSGRPGCLDSAVQRPHCSAVEHESRGPETLSDLAKTITSVFSKPFDSSLNGDTPRELCELVADAPLLLKSHQTLFQPLSDLGFCTESEAANIKEKETLPNKQDDFFPNGLMESMTLVSSKGDEYEKCEIDKPKLNHKCVEENVYNATDETPNSHSNCNKEVTSFEPCKSTNISTSDSKSQSKISSCLEALAALNALKDPSDLAGAESSKTSPKAAFSPGIPCSPLDTVKRPMKPSDSPVSMCSESSGMVSPAVASPPGIPRVRIKTIKTSSGHIRRIVASVRPDSETEEVQSTYESSPCQSMISEDSYNMSPSQNGTSSPNILLNKSETTIRRLQPYGGSTDRRQSIVCKEQKPKKSLEARSSANPNLPKAMHLASLNLVPHSVAASVAARLCNQPSVQTVSSRVSSSVPLVHQVNTTSPSNRAVGTLTRLLHYANPMPTYVPNLNPPPESNISLPPRGYRCLECGDSFGVERSLKYHYNRRSVHIEVTCSHCRKMLLFFNRCALLAHAREHKVNGTVMQCTQLYMKPIAEDQMFVPLRAESPSVQPSLLRSSSQKNAPVMPLYQEAVTPQRLSCSECSQQCSNLKALAGHYQRVAEHTDRLMCKVCSMILPNKCSFRAHQRFHANKSPFCCPECGVLCRSADIHNHVKDNCLHYARKSWYKCLHCDVVFKSLQGQKTHITEKHCEMFFKCSVCPVAFKSSDRCEIHLKNNHSTTNSSPQLIFKCSCETIFKKKHLLYQHFHEDTFKRVKCVFKCPKCHSIFALKQQLMHHFKNTHKGSAEKNSQQMHEQHQDHKIQEKRTVCSVKPFDDPQRKSGQSKAGSKAKRGKRYPCQHCDQSFNFTTSLRKHISKDHDDDERQKSYVCWCCTETTTFTSSVNLKNHMSLMHGIKHADFDQLPKTLHHESNKSLRKGCDGPPVFGIKIEDHTGDAPAEKRQKMSFRCAKCGFVTSDGQEFGRHIPQHKLEENTPQCRHCGLCFTSALALNRHLHIVHKVRASDKETPVQSQSRE